VAGVASGEEDPRTLSVIVPVYNEADGLRAVLAERLFPAACPIAREWILVDDGSTDGSGAILDAAASLTSDRVRVVHKANGGKGTAVRAGLEHATGDFVVVQDADAEYDPADIPRLLEPLLRDEADVVYGSRFRRERHQVHRTFHYFVNRFLTLLSNVLSGIYLTDMETCYKLARTDLVRAMRLRARRFEFEVEFTAYVAKSGARVFEMPIVYYPRTRTAGKKIGWQDGVAAIGHLVRFNLLISPRAAFRDLPDRYRPTE
jgi:glycosyltransferase involved in cell wall biosynthesis